MGRSVRILHHGRLVETIEVDVPESAPDGEAIAEAVRLTLARGLDLRVRLVEVEFEVAREGR